MANSCHIVNVVIKLKIYNMTILLIQAIHFGRHSFELNFNFQNIPIATYVMSAFTMFMLVHFQCGRVSEKNW